MVGYAAIFLNFLVFTAAFILFQLVSETVSRGYLLLLTVGTLSGTRSAAGPKAAKCVLHLLDIRQGLLT